MERAQLRPASTLDALAEARERYAARRPVSAELHRRARGVMPGGSTRSVLDVRPFPFRVHHAAGSRIVDVDGHEYIDLLGDYSAGLLGHSPAPVAAAVSAALERGWSYGGVHVDEIRLAEIVCERFPSIDAVRFTNSGTEANLLALQLARHHTGRERIVVIDGAYHGGFLQFTPAGEPMLVPYDVRRIGYNDPHGAAAAIDDSVAAVLVEPMLGAGGCIPATPEFLTALRDLTEQARAVLVFDEVMTSRMSAGGVQQRLGVIPDLTTLGKYVGGGMTFGALGGRAELMEHFDREAGGLLSHSGTFNNNVVTMAAGLAGLTEVLTPTVLDELYERGERTRAAVAAVLDGADVPLTVTGMGSMFAIHAVQGPVRSTADATAGDPARVELLFHELLDRGVYLAPRGYAAMSVALTDADVVAFLEALRGAVGAVGRAARGDG